MDIFIPGAIVSILFIIFWITFYRKFYLDLLMLKDWGIAKLMTIIVIAYTLFPIIVFSLYIAGVR